MMGAANGRLLDGSRGSVPEGRWDPSGKPPGQMALAGTDVSVIRPRRKRPAIQFRELWSFLHGSLSWLCGLLAAAAAVIEFDFIDPVSFQSPTVRAAVETMICWFAVAGIWLLRGQFVHSRRLRDLLLFGASLTLALTEFSSYALPAVLDLRSGTQVAAGMQCGELIAAAMFAAAALTAPDRLVAPGRWPLVRMATICGAAFIITQLGGLLVLRDHVLGPAGPVEGAPRALHHPLGIALAFGAATLFAYAAWTFALTGRRDRDSVLTLLAGALIVLAAARLDHAVLSWSSPGWIAPRELLRLLAFALLLAALLRQRLRMRARAARAAAIAERRKAARDLHDGLAQDLAFIAAHSSQLSDGLGTDHLLTIAIGRALALSRGTIRELSDWGTTPAREALDAIATELGAQFEINIVVDVDEHTDLAAGARDHVVRIAREAIANAARHGHADNVIVSLKRTDCGVSLRVRDDGCGIRGRDGEPAREGFGLCSIQERAAALGGYLTVRDAKHRGTELEVVLP